MGKIALITGIAGQTGSYLAEHLLDKGYEVHGIIRRNSTPEHQENRIAHLNGKITTHYGDLLDQSSLTKILHEVNPDEIYNLAAQSHVRISFDIPQFTLLTNTIGVLNLLEAYRRECPLAKFIQASSSEMFGNSVDEDGFQRETTPMHPVSPYGCSKLASFNLVKTYRKSYSLHASNSICFNHESPRRASNFVTNKVVKAAVRIKLGLQHELVLGNLDSYRDWGHAKDYARAIHLICTQDMPQDLVIATGQTRSVRDMCAFVFDKLGLEYEKYVATNCKYLRPDELDYLKGDSTKARELLGWEPEYTFEAMMLEMISFWMKYYEALSIPPDSHFSTYPKKRK